MRRQGRNQSFYCVSSSYVPVVNQKGPSQSRSSIQNHPGVDAIVCKRLVRERLREKKSEKRQGGLSRSGSTRSDSHPSFWFFLILIRHFGSQRLVLSLRIHTVARRHAKISLAHWLIQASSLKTIIFRRKPSPSSFSDNYPSGKLHLHRVLVLHLSTFVCIVSANYLFQNRIEHVRFHYFFPSSTA